jgi:acyl-CoA synthetase (NDP forming)
MSRSRSLERLFNPRNVVLVGASDRPGHWSGRVWLNLDRFSFPGRVFPVNPNRTEIWGAPCFPDINSLPEAPDHLAVFVPRERLLPVLADGIRQGVGGITIYAAGFGEGGDDPEGKRLANELSARAHAAGIAVVGPNCMGLACGGSRFSTIPDESLQKLAPGPVAVITQSGALCASINRAINDVGLKLAYLVSCGNQTVCTIADYIDYLADDPKLRVILCYVEGLPDAERFFAATSRAFANGKTTVVVKIGSSEAGRAAALAHTGSLAGNTQAFDVYARQAGVVRLDTLGDGIEAVDYLARHALPRGDSMAVMTNSGALRSLTTEAAERTGAKLAVLSEATHARMATLLDDPRVSNPVDTKLTLPTGQYMACLETLASAPEVDVVLVAEDMPRSAGLDRKVDNLRALDRWVAERSASGDDAKPVTVFSSLIFDTTEFSTDLRRSLPHLAILREPDKTLRVMRAVAALGARRPVPAAIPDEHPVDAALIAAWKARARTLSGPTALNETDSKSLLAAYGIPAPAEQVVATPEAAVIAARNIGFPVVLKALSAAVPHKSDAGLVLLGLADADSVHRAAETLMARCRALHAPLDGILVAQQVSDGVETVLGIHRDPEVGPVVMFGLGGIMVELFKDVAFGSPQIDAAAAAEMIDATQAGRLLAGFRGGKPGDRAALRNALVKLGRLARDLGDVIDAVDVNPFLVRQHGVFALDALVVLRPPTAEA